MNLALETQGARIRQLHLEAHALADQAIERAMEAGRLLIEAKEGLPHGEFGAWVDANCGFTDRTARRYMRIYSNRENLPVGGGIKAALEQLKTKTDTVSDFDLDSISATDWLHISLVDETEIHITPDSLNPGYMHICIMVPADDGGFDATWTGRPLWHGAFPGLYARFLDKKVGPRWRRGSFNIEHDYPGFPGNFWFALDIDRKQEAVT